MTEAVKRMLHQFDAFTENNSAYKINNKPRQDKNNRRNALEAEYAGGDKACGARDTKRINDVYGKVRYL